MESLSVSKVFIVMTCLILLSGCVLSESRHSVDFNAYLSDPPNNSVVQVGTAIDLYGDGYSYIEGRDISNLFFFANGLSLGEAADLTHDTAAHWAGGSVLWTPTTAGEYSLQVMAARRGGTYISRPVRVCVIDFLIDPGRYTAAFLYEGSCLIPDRDSSAVPGTLLLTASATPDHLTYDPTWGSACTPMLSFTAATTDPHEDVAFVTIALKFPVGPGTDPYYLPVAGPDMTLILTPTSTSAGDRTFTGSVADWDLMANLVTFFGNVGGDMTWTAEALGRDGSILITDGPHTIPASPCAPTPLSAPLTLPTTTPASAANCPSGTLYNPGTNRCVQVQRPPEKINSGNNGGDDSGDGGVTCSSYADPSSCTTHACSWDKLTSTCH